MSHVRNPRHPARVVCGSDLCRVGVVSSLVTGLSCVTLHSRSRAGLSRLSPRRGVGHGVFLFGARAATVKDQASRKKEIAVSPRKSVISVYVSM